MKKPARKMIALLLTLTLSLLAFAGCSTNTPASSESQSEASAPPESSAAKSEAAEDAAPEKVLLITAHNMRGLDDNLPDSIRHQPVHCLGHIVDRKPVTLLELVDDNLAGEGAPHLVIRIGGLQCVFNAPD